MASNPSAAMLSKVLEQQMLQTTEIVEQHLDTEIEKFEKMDADELEKLREKRLESMKKAQHQKQEWLSKGHGEYKEIPSEKDFFQEVKESKNVVCHFYRDTTFRCKIVDKHLAILAKKHFETKFIKLNAEKAPFLSERLRIKVIPTMVLVKDGKAKDYIIGFDDLGCTDNFTTETLEWRLGCAAIINYSGNLMEPPFQLQRKSGCVTKMEKKAIRGKSNDSDSDDD
ncbi:thioredoxin domain-containing protein 9 [Carcharodon carcharias]|uniref:thioredoxin domain-containing protein 9 n=1 Tax=Carcharodon carcharias TaxID=13397 RepID=UPI001B7E43BF|nr:thioredoxin domain-containing protein 9 [Carcharodon carcharias]XP_041055034.1 thioredoxin domain-containing protein 9 [Carcharodon carcharias]XP_041055035.1 thioredoxin domain-containing protein 9 [Carcharodon carcharias]XP_041055036.1 thioredoxin domain-containing protein 9 [Carcharodon carcharias]XP_041055037.1 thioredoxin domain-containing protein 9 [Carcharodon carcharias]XP_041055038.1 thioredoxin domain-containing protein 9 [Carcharodon carcharias]